MKNIGKIYIVATPIGNLKDITLRAIETLKSVDIIFAEDTRVTRKLLSHLDIQKPIERFDENISPERIDNLINMVSGGKNAALTTDAGTPNISDPGWKLVQKAVEIGIEIVAIPGASALTSLISISHFSLAEFVFVGFPPAKKGREKFFNSVADEPRAVILYESTHRILKTLESLANTVPEREIIIAKELTKIYERVWRGLVKDINEQFKLLKKEELKGEFVIALNHGQKR